MDIADVGMIKRRSCLCSLDEAFLSLWIPGQLWRQKLEDNGRFGVRVLWKGQNGFGFCRLLDPFVLYQAVFSLHPIPGHALIVRFARKTPIGSPDPLVLCNPACPCGTRRRALAPWPGRRIAPLSPLRGASPPSNNPPTFRNFLEIPKCHSYSRAEAIGLKSTPSLSNKNA